VEVLKIKLNTNEQYTGIKKMIREEKLHTVCEEAKCPNIHECWAERRTATFMILGSLCTRACRFCAVQTGLPTELDLQEENDEGEIVDNNENVAVDFDAEKTHDIWEECIEIDEKTLRDFTEKFADNAKKGSVPTYIENMIKSLKNSKGELPWNLYLKKLSKTLLRKRWERRKSSSRS